MISRQWCGIAKKYEAERYISHLQAETFSQLELIHGFRGASILKREVPSGIEFRIVTLWDSLDAIRAFAGANPEAAVVPENVRKMMVSFDAIVAHYEIVQ